MHYDGKLRWGAAVLMSGLMVLVSFAPAKADSYAGQTAQLTMEPTPSVPGARDPHIDYNIDLAGQKFLMKVPAQYTDGTPYGLVIYLPADDDVQQVPAEWDSVLDQRKLIFLSPHEAGKDVAISRRLGLAVLGALWSEHHWKIDTQRVYVTGSGEQAHVAGLLGFYAPNIFSGNIQVCGADFYASLAAGGKPAPADSKPDGKLLGDATAAEIAAAKSFHFVFLTGKEDPHQQQIERIARDGYAGNGFRSTLIDGLGISPQGCTPRRVDQALDALEGIKSSAPIEPEPAPWMAKDPSQWPRILLSNHVIESSGAIAEMGSSSLGRMPNGVVVLLTARHLLGGQSLTDFASTYKSWTVYGSSPNSSVRIAGVATSPIEPASFDGLVLYPASQGAAWPSTVLPIRQEALEIGETVYLVAVPNHQSRARQQVFKGKIVSQIGNKQLQYNVDGEFDTMGCSGAPIIDEYGRLAAINLGHLLTQSVPGKRQLTCMATSEVLAAIELPANVHPTAERPTAATNAPAGVGGQDAASPRADAALRRAQLLLDNKVYDKAREQLQGIIDAYPKTEAGKKARAMLGQIPSQ